MKRVIMAFATIALIMGSTGCVHRNLARNGCCEGCGSSRGGCRQDCGPGLAHGGGGGGAGGRMRSYEPSSHYSTNGMPGPSSAQVAYPYYTTRGPRDFLLDNPPSIGR